MHRLWTTRGKRQAVGSQAAHEDASISFLGQRRENISPIIAAPHRAGGKRILYSGEDDLHARTNLEVIAKFLPVRFAITQHDDFVRVEATPPLR